MVTDLRFTAVRDFDDEYEATRNFASVFNAEKSLYEVTTLSSISVNDENAKEDFEASLSTVQLPVFSCGNQRYLAVSVGQDLSIFKVGLKTQFCKYYDISSTIVGMEWLPKIDILLVVLDDGRFMFVNPSENGEVVEHSALELNLERPLKKCKVTASVHDSICVIVLSETTGTVFIAHIPDYNGIIESKGTDKFVEQFCAVVTGLIVPQEHHYPFDDTVIHVGLPQSFGLFYSTVAARPPLIATSSAWEGQHQFDQLEEPNDFLGCRAARRYGYYLFVLMNNNELVVYEEITLMQLARLDIGYTDSSHSIVDFHFADLADDLSNLEGCKLFLVLEAGDRFKLEVLRISVDLATKDLLYSVDVASNSIILPDITADSGLLLVEPFPGNKNAVFVRTVTESLPHLWLEKLIKTRRFQEAEKFAKNFKLDCQMVYRAIMNDALDRLYTVEEPDEALFQEVLRSFVAVEDSDEIADLCANAVAFLDRFDWILRLLTYVEQRQVKDSSSLEQLAALRYNLTTYRQIFNPKEEGNEAHWKDFAENNWFEIFKSLCRSGLLYEARLLWQRHREVALAVVNVENFNSILGDISEAIYPNWNAVDPAVELLEGEIIPTLLMNGDTDLTDLMVDWILDIADRLETAQPDSFPAKSLWVSQAMSRAIEAVVQSAITPGDQIEIMKMLSMMRSDETDVNVRMGALNFYSHNLIVMCKLKEKYALRMSYNTFLEQDVQSICHMILERIKSVEKISEQVAKFAIPYMEEYKLKKDETLNEYIRTVAGENIYVSTTNSNPWDERCLEISRSIENIHIRCQAVIDIARRSSPPWTNTLNQAVNNMLNTPSINKELVQELHRQRHTAEFGQILLRHKIPLSVLDSAKKYSRSFLSILRCICRPELESEDRQQCISDCLQLISLLKKLGSTVSEVKPEVVYAVYATAIINDSINKAIADGSAEEICNARLVNFMNDVPTEMTHTVAVSLVEKNSERLKHYAFTQNSTNDKVRRLAVIGISLCLVERYYRGSDKRNQALSLRAVRNLQQRFDQCVGLDFFESNQERYEFFASYLKRMAQWSWAEVVQVSSALLIKQSDACEFVVKTSIREQVSPALALTMLRANIQWEQQDSFIRTAMECIQYTLTAFSMWANENQMPGVTGAAPEVVVECVGLLHEILPALLNSLNTMVMVNIDEQDYDEDEEPKERENYLAWFKRLGRVTRYIEVFVQFLKQCYFADSAGEDLMDVDYQEATEVVESGVTEIYGINHRVQVYHCRKDGTVYDRDSGVKNFAQIAMSVLGDDEAGQLNFQQLFAFLDTHSQSLLEIHARILAASLGVSIDSEECYSCVYSACTKILGQANGDIWLVNAAIALLDKTQCTKLTADLRQWCSKKAPRIRMNCLRVCQMSFIQQGDCDLWNVCTSHYKFMYWLKKLAKYEGTIHSKDIKNVAACVKEFVRCLLPPSIIAEFCADFELSVNDVLAQYAFALCVKCSNEGDTAKVNKMIDLADAALLRLDLTSTPDGFNLLYNTLMAVCPYQYDIIQVLLRHLDRFAQGNEDPNIAAILSDLKIVYEYVTFNPRVNESTSVEVKWYQDRQTIISAQTSFTGQELKFNENPHNPDLSITSGDYYEKQEIIAKKLPPIADRRLPFHVLLLTSDLDKNNVVNPVVNMELSITSVASWVDLVSMLKLHMRISRTLLLAEAIKNKIIGAADTSSTLTVYESQCIYDLIYRSKNQVLVTRHLSNVLNRITISQLKLTVLHIGIRALKEWQKQEKETDSEVKKTVIKKMSDHTKCCSIRLILQEKRLLDETTDGFVSAPLELIAYIYAHQVDWNDPDDIKFKFDVAQSIARIHDFDIHDIHFGIVRKWMNEDDKPSRTIDPDATLDDMVPMIESTSESVPQAIPYNDVSCTRIVYLMRCCQGTLKYQELMMAVKQLLAANPNNMTGGYRLQVRVLCCLFRLFKGDDEFIQVCGQSLNDASTTVRDKLLYKQLLSISRLDDIHSSFLKAENTKLTKLVRDLMKSSTSRNNDQLFHFLSCVVIDHAIEDKTIISDLTIRLANKPKSLHRLLVYCKEIALRLGKSMAIQWIRVFEALISDKHYTETGAVRGLLCFLLSCPEEFGSAVGNVRQYLIQQQFLSTELLALIAANPTCHIDKNKLRAVANSNDFPFRWMKEKA